jgi:hypothetical protein
MSASDALGHLLALRAVLKALETNIDAAIAALTEPASQELCEVGCVHPLSRRLDLTPAGSKVDHWYCKDCGYKEPPDDPETVQGKG